MNLRDFAVRVEAFDGRVVFYMMPFQGLRTNIVMAALNKLEPENSYTHKESGEVLYSDPIDNPDDDPIIEAQREVWEVDRLWSSNHDFFIACTSRTVDIEFNFNGTAPVELRGLQLYWQERDNNVAQSWQRFTHLIGQGVINAWIMAYNDSQDTSMDGPEALQQEVTDDTDPESSKPTRKRGKT